MRSVTPGTLRTLAWASWDWGAAGFNAVIVTFVFVPYLAKSVAPADGPLSGSEYIAWMSAAAGLVILLLAPVMGQRADARGRRRTSLAIWSALTWATMLGLFVVRDSPAYLLIGLVLIAAGEVFFQLAEVNYFAMLPQVSTPRTLGRVSGLGWAAGYFGGILLLAVVYLGMINPAVGWFGVTDADGLKYRAVAVAAGIWFLIFGLPVLFAVPENAPAGPSRPLGLVASYRKLIADIGLLWRQNRPAAWFLVGSAIYRDGLSGIFTFGAVVAVNVFQLSASEVLIFGIAANLAAGLAAAAGGLLEDRIGPKRIILGSLAVLIGAGLGLLWFSGTLAFWILGLTLCLGVGPAQASSRSYLARLAKAGHEGEMFGLYATTGRAVSFAAPVLFAIFAAIGGERIGMLGIVVLLIIGGAVIARLPNQPSRRTVNQDSGSAKP